MYKPESSVVSEKAGKSSVPGDSGSRFSTLKLKPRHIFAATRFPFLSVSIFPVIFSLLFLWIHAGILMPLESFICFVGMVAIHLSANTLNDYFDWDGSDARNPNASLMNGGSRFLLSEHADKKLFLILSVSLLAVALTTLIFLLMRGKWLALPVAAIGAFLGLAYSFTPVSLQSRGLGELAVFLCFGPLITLGMGAVLLEEFKISLFLLGAPFGFQALIIILINEIPDAGADRAARKKTLVVRLGPCYSWVLLGLAGLGNAVVLGIIAFFILKTLLLFILWGLSLVFGLYSTLFAKRFWQDRSRILILQRLGLVFHLISGALLMGSLF